ncbi:MAG: neutral/alkaline non-lysosomal ceramidase N-terminal domain-containing protein [Planctomycetota bacterium]
MKFGFGKIDITPRIGVGLYGYGPYLCRFSNKIRDRLYARALAASDDGRTVVLASCDLVGVAGEVTEEVRERVSNRTGLPGDSIMVHCTHTHCGPRTKYGIGQGMLDDPYVEILPVRVAEACIQAVQNLSDGALHRAVVAAEGIGYSREHDVRPRLDEALKETWRPAKPELTDTEAQVFRIDRAGMMAGFFSYFSCHPVVGSADCRAIHGDYCGVATNLIEQERPGTVGLFLQGCHGNINTCVVHHPEQESLLALDVIASRYARSVRAGIESAERLDGSGVRSILKSIRIKRAPLPMEKLRQALAESEKVVKAPAASDGNANVRGHVVRLKALRKEIARQEAGIEFDENVAIHGLRIGDITMVGAPFEIAHRYKRRVQAVTGDRTLVLSLVDDSIGYAPEREAFAREGNYAASTVPYLLGYPPFSPDIEDTLVGAFIGMDAELRGS